MISGAICCHGQGLSHTAKSNKSSYRKDNVKKTPIKSIMSFIKSGFIHINREVSTQLSQSKWAEMRRVLGSSPGAGNNLGYSTCRGGGARTPSEHHWGNLEQDTKSQNAHIGPWMSRQLIQVYPVFLHIQLTVSKGHPTHYNRCLIHCGTRQEKGKKYESGS